MSAAAPVTFRELCRVQALACRGSDDERRRLLMDMFADAKANRCYNLSSTLVATVPLVT
jgi:hypothetical protein